MEQVTPGVYPGISSEEYHAGPGLSSSDLKLLARSPLHYISAKRTPPKETDAMKLGTAVHCNVLEPERFLRDYAQAPDVDRRTKAGKEAWAELEATGKIVLTAEEWEKAVGMARAVWEHPIAKRLLSGGKSEQSIYWEQHVSGNGIEKDILCKCRPDYIKHMLGGLLLVDLKTTQDASIPVFQRRAYWELGYHISAAHYMTGVAEAMEPPQAFIFVAVENKAPYAVNVFQASSDFLAEGAKTAREMYEVFAYCEKCGKWQGYDEGIKMLELPRSAA